MREPVENRYVLTGAHGCHSSYDHKPTMSWKVALGAVLTVMLIYVFVALIFIVGR